MSRVIHFEIPAADPEKLSVFYQKVFGWKFDKWAGPMEYWIIVTGNDGEAGINGGMMRKPGGIASTTNTIGVDSVDNSIAAVTKAGGKLVMPKTPIPGVGYFAYCEDTEGNMLGVMQADSSAK
jgi:uncharacterized protein